jgi:protein SFI1
MQPLADDFYVSHLLEQALYQWRVHLRYRVKYAQQSKMARRFFIERSAWVAWKRAVWVKRLEKRSQGFEKRTLKSFFEGELAASSV